MKTCCTKCSVEYRIEKNEVAVIEMASFGPYKIWFADAWKCPKCGDVILSGFGMNPIAEHYEPDFAATLERMKASYQTYTIYEE